MRGSTTHEKSASASVGSNESENESNGAKESEGANESENESGAANASENESEASCTTLPRGKPHLVAEVLVGMSTGTTVY